MEAAPLSQPLVPHLGLFWFVADATSETRFLSYSRSWVLVPEVGGFKTLNEGHVDVWPTFQRRYPFLRSYEYEWFPRGRVNWVEQGDIWLLLLDPRLKAPSFVSHVVETWRLPRDRLQVLTDPHYRSSQPIRLPITEEP